MTMPQRMDVATSTGDMTTWCSGEDELHGPTFSWPPREVEDNLTQHQR
jgi:hypothetical protein